MGIYRCGIDPVGVGCKCKRNISKREEGAAVDRPVAVPVTVRDLHRDRGPPEGDRDKFKTVLPCECIGGEELPAFFFYI